MTELKFVAVSLAAFHIAALHLFLQGVSLATNFVFRRIKKSAAETLNPYKTKIFALGEADKAQKYFRISSFEANNNQKF